MDKISKIGWFTRREGLVGKGEYLELNSEGNGQLTSGESDKRGC